MQCACAWMVSNGTSQIIVCPLDLVVGQSVRKMPFANGMKGRQFCIVIVLMVSKGMEFHPVNLSHLNVTLETIVDCMRRVNQITSNGLHLINILMTKF